MTNPNNAPESINPGEEEFAFFVDEIVRKIQSKNLVDWDRYMMEYPQHARELRQMRPAIELLVDLGHECSDGSKLLSTQHDVVGHERQLGDYRILREIARGGMGIVYEAEQISLKRRVALKVLPFAGMLDNRQQQRFKNEAQAAAGLHHTNIVPVYSVGCERGVHYYAMQYIEGQTIAAVIAELQRREGLYPEEDSAKGGSRRAPTDAVSPRAHATLNTSFAARFSTEKTPRGPEYYQSVAELGIQLADALDYAHSLGVIHRDIKPSNLLLDTRQSVWITDFGLAQIERDSNLTMTGDVLGTLRYMSPEQAQGARALVDHRTDIYSLGITLYELLTLRPAFSETHRQKLMQQVIQDDPASPRHFDRAIPKDLETILFKATAKEPLSRYNSANDFADDLRRFLQHEPIKARRPSLADRVVKWSRRYRDLVVIGGLLTAVLAIVIAVASVIVMQERGERSMEQQNHEYEAALGRIELAEERGKRLREEEARKYEVSLADNRKESARLHRYVSDIQLAWQAWNDSQLTAMEEHLLRSLPKTGETDIRSWEWHYLWKLAHDVPEPMGRHDGQAFDVRLSFDESLLATCGEDGVRVWDTKTLKQIKYLDAHKGDVNSVRFSPDDQLLVTGGDDKSIKIWETKNWTVVRTLPTESDAGAGFSLDGRRLVVVEFGNEPQQNRVTLYNAQTWTIESTWHAHDRMIQAADMSPDGHRLVTVALGEGYRVWDLDRKDPGEAHKWGQGSDIFSILFLPDGKHLVGGGSAGLLHIWDCERPIPDPYYSIRAHSSWIQRLSITPDGQSLITASRSRSVHFWRIKSQGNIDVEPYAVFKLPAEVSSARLDAKGNLFTADIDGNIRRHRLEDPSGLPIRVPSHRENNFFPSFLFIGDGKRFVTAEKGIHVYETETGQLIKTLKPPEESENHIAVTSDGSKIAVVSEAGEITLWDGNALNRLSDQAIAHRRIVPPFLLGEPLVFTPNNRSLVAFCKDENPVRIDSETGLIEPFADRTIHRMVWSPDGHFAFEFPGYGRQLSNTKTGQIYFTRSGTALLQMTGNSA